MIPSLEVQPSVENYWTIIKLPYKISINKFGFAIAADFAGQIAYIVEIWSLPFSDT